MIGKRLFDLVSSSLGLIVVSPLLSIIAIWIKIDSPGPIIFQQTRVGKGGKEFKIYKFRTMFVNAETLGKSITVGNDFRITKAGKLLRKYKLDELPQLVNVFKGEMSLVGPRPEVPRYVAFYTSEQRQVLKIRPGITDLASIRFRNESEILAQSEDPEAFYINNIIPQKIALNQQYIQRASLATDLIIIWQTIAALFKNDLLP
ncbi:sugar transferase [Gloeocapsa sp. PCC 73106]|uniref:sugar transferase n=1 Tax=Gloeocapsa sp. PCC 73106 TaxID=102232 RepID=UPI0002AC5F7E|nr:sugar transferase [Gloeocapsa sp. PCC 73106]ELR99052.1 glycosyl transferase possibly involved in lipopolysaccharide synthesis [Gloeocapsa sp. PCC 73106]